MSENRRTTYTGPDWQIALARNVTVALEFAAHDLRSEPPNVARAAKLIGEAMKECIRLQESWEPCVDPADLEQVAAMFPTINANTTALGALNVLIGRVRRAAQEPT
jgi:hypothetical protein